jgi:hypothetical protein
MSINNGTMNQRVAEKKKSKNAWAENEINLGKVAFLGEMENEEALNHRHTQISHVRMKYKEIYGCGV